MVGGNENSPEDMGAYIANCDKIREATGAHVLVIHHSPKHNNNTPRGHSSLFGAVDVLIRIEKRQTGNVATVEASKDDEDGWEIGFSLKVVDVGFDEDGGKITSCAVVIGEEAPAKIEKPLTGNKALAREALINTLGRHGQLSSGYSDIADGTRCTPVELWRIEFYAIKEGNLEAKQRAFNRALSGLRDMKYLDLRDDFVWLISKGE
jgi:hypothetical protein